MRLESLWGDIRFAFRIFKRSPAVALTVIGTLAVALGLNATAYSFFTAYVVKPAAVHDPGFGAGVRNYTGVGAAAEAPMPFGTLIAVEWGYGIQGINSNGSRGTHVIRISGYKVF